MTLTNFMLQKSGFAPAAMGYLAREDLTINLPFTNEYTGHEMK